MTAAIYTGAVKHRRIRPRVHRLHYRVFSFLLDIDAVEETARPCRFFSYNKLNVFSFYDKDHGTGTNEPLRAQVERHLRAAGLTVDGGAITLLTMPRILGYVFNPLSVYFCYRRDGRLLALLYEVSNTFGERHNYLAPVADGAREGAESAILRQECAKRFHVSPFMDMAMTYDFRIVPPGARMAIAIAGRDAEGPIIIATLAARRQVFDDATLIRIFFAYPLLTLKVVAGIHWEALFIWAKGVRLRRRPQPPAVAVTIVRSDEA